MNANDWASLIPLALLLFFAYLVLIRPARRRAHEIHAVQSALSVGDEVMLTSGIYGHVTEVGEERLRLQVAPGIEVAVARAAVAKILTDVPEAPAEASTSYADEPVTDAGEEPVAARADEPAGEDAAPATHEDTDTPDDGTSRGAR